MKISFSSGEKSSSPLFLTQNLEYPFLLSANLKVWLEIFLFID